VVGDNVRIGKRCVFQGSSESVINISNNVTINDGCFITSLYQIDIGAGTSIGEYTSIRDYNHNYSDKNRPLKSQGYSGSRIKIGEECWIGRGCTILPGVEIGMHAVIGANSVVTKNIPANEIHAGVPAKFIRNINA
jgi:acetyltransferase-like isoleucine patch superfamily enzyme